MLRILVLVSLLVGAASNAWAYAEIYSYTSDDGLHVEFHGIHGNNRQDALTRPSNAKSFALILNNAIEYNKLETIKSLSVCPEKNSGYYAWTGYWAHSKQLGPQGGTCRAKSIPQAVEEVYKLCQKINCWVVDGGFYVTIRQDDSDLIAICDYKDNKLVENASRWMVGSTTWMTHKDCPKTLDFPTKNSTATDSTNAKRKSGSTSSGSNRRNDANGSNNRTITTASGLKYMDLKVGNGPTPVRGKKVTVHYSGTLDNGKKIDSSIDRKQPFTFTLGTGHVIDGWEEGIISMKKGGKRKLIIPANLGYGAKGVGNTIPPGATLIYEIELLGINE